MERKLAPEERYEQLRLGETLEAADEDLEAYVTTLLEGRGKRVEEPDWLRDLLARSAPRESPPSD
jgi:hypothetical protein